MHPIQEKIARLVDEKNLGQMTLREIGALVGERSPQKIKHHLSMLERRGLIKINKHRGTIEKAHSGGAKNSPLVSVPIVGAANCGPATIFAEENVQGYLKISNALLAKKKDVFALKASGLSMNRASIGGKNIEDGDYLIIDAARRSPADGDIVCSVIDDMATIKRYVWDKEGRQIVLVAESSKDFPPIYIHADDDFSISGTVIQVVKKPRRD